MPWVKLDDHFPDHPKVIAAGPAAAWLHVAGLCYAARYLTDGKVPRGVVGRLCETGGDDPAELAARLVAAGLWIEEDGHYRIHDYLEYNPSAVDVKAEREAARARMQANRAKQRARKKGGPSAGALVEYLTQCALEPSVVGSRPERDFDHIPPAVRTQGRRLLGLKAATKEERQRALADALDALDLGGLS